MKFVDEVKILVSSGHGGAGAISFARAPMAPRGGPDGGDGGRGGHIVFRVDSQQNSLLDYRFRRRFIAPNGEPGRSANQTGADGGDLVLVVPPGTVVKSADGELLLDLSKSGDTIFLKGGRGGKGNDFFKTSVNQAPEKARPGEPGVQIEISLELKLIADVGVIGYPNAGKSTLISRISAAKPKIADYPFTTLSPNLGVVQVGDDQTVVVADIPGLVPGAHKGVGLGTQFLRHIERTNLFVHLIDGSGGSGRDPLQDYHDIMNELVEYDKTKADHADYRPLLSRRQILAINKVDSISAVEREVLAARFVKAGVPVRMISAAAGIGIKELVFEIGRIVAEERVHHES